MGRKNFIQATNVTDHAKSDQHEHAMNLHRREQAQAQGASVASYATIAQSLSFLSEDERRQLKAKFDITRSSYREAVSTQHGVLEYGSDLDVNEHQKVRHYLATVWVTKKFPLFETRYCAMVILRSVFVSVPFYNFQCFYCCVSILKVRSKER